MTHTHFDQLHKFFFFLFFVLLRRSQVFIVVINSETSLCFKKFNYQSFSWWWCCHPPHKTESLIFLNQNKKRYLWFHQYAVTKHQRGEESPPEVYCFLLVFIVSNQIETLLKEIWYCMHLITCITTCKQTFEESLNTKAYPLFFFFLFSSSSSPRKTGEKKTQIR